LVTQVAMTFASVYQMWYG